MNRKDFIDAVAKEAGFSRSVSTAAVDAFIAVVTNTLQSGQDINIINFLKFETKRVPERKYRKNLFGKNAGYVTVPAHNCVKVTAKPALINSVNDSLIEEGFDD